LGLAIEEGSGGGRDTGEQTEYFWRCGAGEVRAGGNRRCNKDIGVFKFRLSQPGKETADYVEIEVVEFSHFPAPLIFC
jgi:hypothetical protein